MVKIIRLSEEEVKHEEYEGKLVEIAKEVFPQSSVKKKVGRYLHFFPNKRLGERSVLYINAFKDSISIYDKTNFDYALQLAKEYESRLKKEFSIMIRYVD